MRLVNRDETAQIVVASSTAAAATCTATLTGDPNRRTCIQGFVLTGLGATGATVIEMTITGTPVTLKFSIVVPAGVTTAITPLNVLFGDLGIPASADDTDIVVSVPTFGSGNTKVALNAWGVQV